jgi:hypothetical protein
MLWPAIVAEIDPVAARSRRPLTGHSSRRPAWPVPPARSWSP